MTALLDTNILLDILSSSREGHDTALQLLQLIRRKKITGVLTTQSIIDAAYIQTQRQKVPVQDFKAVMKIICSIVKIISVSSDDIARVNESNLNDYEDAAQISCALDNWCDVIVSNDSGIKHYTDLDILSPQELIDRCLNQA